MTTSAIAPEVLEILRRSKIDGHTLILPPGQLPAPLYQKVNAVLGKAGGKWNRSAKGHVFPSDPRERFGLMVETGKVENLKQKFQAFFTPPDLADRIAELADVSGFHVLEPSAGKGALVAACYAAEADRVDAVEIDGENLAALEKANPKGDVYHDDFLAWEREAAGTAYDRIVMNPPFTKNQDIAHVAAALRLLERDGILVAIMGPQVDRPAFKTLVAGRNHDIEKLPAGTFRSSGTDVATILLTVRNW